MKRRLLLPLSLTAAAVLLLSGCSDASGGTGAPPGSSSSPAKGAGKPVKIAYQQFGDGRIMEQFLTAAKTEYEAANPGSTVELMPIQAAENDYSTKLALMMKSEKTTPDIVHEDTFLINSHIQAGYLRPLDDYLSSWDQWGQYVDNAKAAGKALDGKTYGVPDGTDTRGLWYNKKIFAKAGVPVPWEPKSWDDVLAAARAVKEKVPDVTPINVYASKAAGEATSMQGFEMLLYGAGGSLYDAESKKWVVGSRQFRDSLGFVRTVFSEKLGPKPQLALDANLGNLVGADLLPGGKLAIALDGSWMPGNWGKTGSKPWPEWSDTIGVTQMPTQAGQAPGSISLSGGWTWALAAKSANPDQAFEFVKVLQNPKNATKYTVDAAQIAVRTDVAKDPAYKETTSKIGPLSEVVAVTQYRPAYAEYPRISNEIQVAAESVMTGQDPERAAQAYDAAVKRIVGDENTVTR